MRTVRFPFFVSLITFTLLVGLTGAVAEVPGLLNYQGYLTDDVGLPITDPALDMEFTIWDDETDDDLAHLLWTETWDSGTSAVAVIDGYCSVLLGSYQVFGALFEDNDDLWLEIEVDGSLLSPRKRIASSAYGKRAGTADTVSWDGITDIPEGFADGTDDRGIDAELDPTVLESVKDGVDFTELSGAATDAQVPDDITIAYALSAPWSGITGIPAGFADGVDDGITSEDDPQVGAISTYGVPKWNGASLIQGSMYDKSSKVGIGTSSPACTLDVQGTSHFSDHVGIGALPGTFDALIVKGGGSTFYETVFLRKPTDLDISLWVYGDVCLTDAGCPEIGAKLYVQGDTVITGNLGVGTLFPGEHQLYLKGNQPYQDGSTIRTENTDPGGIALWALNDSESSTDATMVVENHGTGHLLKGFGNTGEVFALANNGSLGLGTTSPAQMLDVRGNAHISGNLGLGKTDPERTLDLEGNARFRGEVSMFAPANATSSPLTVVHDASGSPAIHAVYNAEAGWSPVIQSYTYGVGPMYWGGSQSGGEFVVENDGSVGIGVRFPVQKLDVRGNAYVSDKIGIRTASPDEALTVNGNVRIDGGGVLKFRDNPGGGGSDEAYISYYPRSGESTTLEIRVNNDADDHIALMPSGNVGIGTSTPVQKLDVRGNGYITGGLGLGTAGVGSHKIYANGSGWAIDGSSGYFYNSNSGGIALWAENYSSTDTTLGLGNNGTGQLIKGFKNGGLKFQVSADGALWAVSKSFYIDHPLDPENKALVHGSLEGPELAVYYRGEATLEDGEAVIELPDYFEALTLQDGRTIQLTCLDGFSPLFVAGKIEDGRFIVETTDYGEPDQKFFWEVKAVRADIDPLAVEIAKEDNSAILNQKRPVEGPM